MQKLVLFNICIYSSTNGKKRKTSTISQERGPGRGRGQGRGRGRCTRGDGGVLLEEIIAFCD